jgi:opacity protein-like surface antigen
MLKKVSLSLTLFSFILIAHADEIHSPSKKCNEYFISFSGGPGWTNAGTTQTIALEPDVINTYVPQNLTNSHLLANGELFVGVQNSFFDYVQSQFGLALYASSHANLEGYIQVDGNPNFQNYEYQYKINHAHVALKSKWIAENELHLNPYLSASIGVGLNHSYDFSINPLISQEIPAPPFQSHTKVAFSYTLGAGFQHTIDCHYTIALGYELGSWGASSLNRAKGQTSGHGLRLNNLYTQSLMFNVTYIL